MKINHIMKFLSIFLCGVSFSASAQLLDLLGSGAVGGTIMKEEIASVNRGVKTLKYTQIVQALSQNSQIIRINHMGNYHRVGRSDISGNPFRPYSFDVGSVGNNRFYIEVSGVDMDMCKRLVSTNIGAVDVNVNGTNKNKTACTSSSKIKFIFN